MASDLISRRLRSMLMDYLAGSSVLREIENEFDAADIPYRPRETQSLQGQRRTLVQGYYNGLDFSDPRDARKFLNVLAVFMRNMEQWCASVGTTELIDKFHDQLRRDGYTYQQGGIVPTTAAARLADAKAIAQGFDAAHIAEQIQRIEVSIDADPALAIGTAKELTESCFKTVLGELHIEYGTNDDLLKLGKTVFKALKLVPDDVPNSAKGAETIKRLLSNLSTVVQGLAEIRGLYGTGHGRDGRAKGVQPRHARLAVGAASALVTFVFQTHLEERSRRPAQ
jgi:Abortive infection C-terminus